MDISIIYKLLLSAALGGIIGLEREKSRRPAGLRTHILVSTSATLIAYASVHGFLQASELEGIRWDGARIAAQIVSGIGFLGAGTIIREGATIRGLTTAASLWAVAGIGLAIGLGLEEAAVATCVIAVLTLIVLNMFEKRYLTSKHLNVSVTVEDSPGKLGNIACIFGEMDLNITSIELSPSVDENKMSIDMVIQITPGVNRNKIMEEVSSIEGVYEVKID